MLEVCQDLQEASQEVEAVSHVRMCSASEGELANLQLDFLRSEGQVGHQQPQTCFPAVSCWVEVVVALLDSEVLLSPVLFALALDCLC